MSLTIECREHPDYDGQTRPEYLACNACTCLRAWVLGLSPAEVGARVKTAMGEMRIREEKPQGATDPSFCATCGQPSEHSTHSPGDLRSHTFKPEGAPECEAVQRFGRHDIHHGSCRGCGLFTGER